MLLLDTCVLLWLAADQARLSAVARGAIAAHAGRLYVSAISAFEVGVKSQRGLLDLPLRADEWFERVLAHHGVIERPLTGRVAARSTLLPSVHRDPADRIIVATALEAGMPIVTPDRHVRAYPGVEVIW